MTARRVSRLPLFGAGILLATFACAVLQGPVVGATAARATFAIQPVSAHIPAPVDVEHEIRRTFGAQARTALCIAGAESGWRPDAVNENDDGSRDRGVFQINSRWHPDVSDAAAFDVRANVAYAYQLSDGGRDWSHWAELTRERCGVS